MNRSNFNKKFPDEASAREYLESIIWKDGRVCPHCGSIDHSWLLKSDKVSTGTYQCGEKECKRLFTVTTDTPLHSTKLPLLKWVEAIWFITSMPKGISSVTLSRMISVTQKTAWKMGHAVRLLMEQANAPKLQGIVEVDEKYLGGKPRKAKGVKHSRGRGTKKQGILVAVERGGDVRTVLIDGSSAAEIAPKVLDLVDTSAHLMTDENPSYNAVGRFYSQHDAVTHSAGQFASGIAHNNTAESFNATLERMKIGVYHFMSKKHISRYIADASFRWNTRKTKENTYSFDDLTEMLLSGCLKKNLRWTKAGSII